MNQEQLLVYISEVMEEIMENVSSVDDLLKDEKATALMQSIFEALDRLGMTFTEAMPGILNESFATGLSQASTALTETVAGAAQVSSALSAAVIAETGSRIMEVIESAPTKVQKRIHLEAVSHIADDTMLDLTAAIRTAKESANSTIMDTLNDVKKTMAKNLITGDTNRVTTAQIKEKFAKEGLTCFTTKDGKKLPLDYYAKLVVETKIRTAHVEGSNRRYLDSGVSLVQIHEQQDTCHICAKYRGMVVSLTGKDKGFKSKFDKDVKFPPYHPHCHGTTRPFVKEFKTDEEIQVEKDKWKNFDPEKDTRTAAQKKAYEKEQAIRRKANQEKKDYAKIVSVLGNDAPKTLGAYRRMKKANSSGYKEMVSKYKTAINPKKESAPKKASKEELKKRFVKVTESDEKKGSKIP
ncbi:phage minor capsid protein [Niallia sp. 03190]|uniref:phage minor capsid protein n=1 Tax=Niallia sp. 03190 TaxID=3458061 RepID=UPI004043CD1D